MDISEVILKRQIDMNNKWPKVSEVETEAYNLVKDRLEENGISQLMIPLKINSDDAFNTFLEDKQLVKIFSAFLDTYDMLPFHPDMAFDAIWRTLEYTIRVYSVDAWKTPIDYPLDNLYGRISKEVIASKVKNEASLQNAFTNIFDNISITSVRYMVTRIFFEKQLSIAPQQKFVKARAEVILTKEVIANVKEAYQKEDGSMDTKDIHDIARRFIRLFKGEDAEFGGKVCNPLTLETRIELLFSVMLYSSRCERFHGDIYSPFKSSKADLSRYYNYYFLVLASIVLFWILFSKLIERKKLVQIIDYVALEKVVNETLVRMNDILNNK